MSKNIQELYNQVMNTAKNSISINHKEMAKTHTKHSSALEKLEPYVQNLDGFADSSRIKLKNEYAEIESVVERLKRLKDTKASAHESASKSMDGLIKDTERQLEKLFKSAKKDIKSFHRANGDALQKITRDETLATRALSDKFKDGTKSLEKAIKNAENDVVKWSFPGGTNELSIELSLIHI